MDDDDLDMDMTFEEASEFLERAGGTASTELLLEMLRDALAAIEGLSARVLAIELARLQDARGSGVYGGPGVYPSYHQIVYGNGNVSGSGTLMAYNKTDNKVVTLDMVKTLVGKIRAVNDAVST